VHQQQLNRFIGMMTGATNVTTMGARTAGSSGNPKIINLPLDITVSVPRWITYLPDGTTPLDERGVSAADQVRSHRPAHSRATAMICFPPRWNVCGRCRCRRSDRGELI